VSYPTPHSNAISPKRSISTHIHTPCGFTPEHTVTPCPENSEGWASLHRHSSSQCKSVRTALKRCSCARPKPKNPHRQWRWQGGPVTRENASRRHHHPRGEGQDGHASNLALASQTRQARQEWDHPIKLMEIVEVDVDAGGPAEDDKSSSDIEILSLPPGPSSSQLVIVCP